MATKEKPITFWSKNLNLRVIVQPKIESRDPFGQKVTDVEGIDAVFGPDGRFTPEDVFNEKNELVCSKEKLIELLQQHKVFDTRFFITGQEPGRPKPYDEDVIDEITDATLAQDVAALEAILEREQSTHNRTSLVTQAESALEKLRERGTAPVAETHSEAPAVPTNDEARAFADDPRQELEALILEIGDNAPTDEQQERIQELSDAAAAQETS